MGPTACFHKDLMGPTGMFSQRPDGTHDPSYGVMKAFIKYEYTKP